MSRKSKIRFPIWGLSILTILAMLLTACGAQGTPTQTGTTPVSGGTWIDDLPAAPSSLIPLRAASVYAVTMDQALYAPLIYSDEKGAFHAGLLTDIPSLSNGGISADYKTYKFTLRSGLKWSDGQPLDARDVDFTWKIDQNPKFSAQATAGFDQIEASEISADNLTITLHLKKPYAPFLAVWVDGGSGPLPRHTYEPLDPASFATSPENHKPTVVSGPFMVQSSEAKKTYTLVKNPNYYRKAEGLPYLDKVVFNTGVSSDTILQQVKAGSVTSSWNLNPLSVPDYQKISNYQVVNPLAGGFEGLFFNFKNDAVKDVVVRKAIMEAIDRQALWQRIKSGIGSVLCIDVPSTIPSGYEANPACPKYDVTDAKKLLDDAGWKVGSDGVRAKNGVRLEIPLITNTYDWREKSLEFIQSQLNQINVKTVIKQYESGDFFSTILPEGDPAKYGIAEFGFDLGFDPDDSAIAACNQIPTDANGLNGENYSFYCNSKLDPLFDQELATPDANQRNAIFKQIHSILLQDLPYVGLFDSAHPAVAKKTTHNYMPGPMGAEEAVTIATWWCDGGKC